jgi:hypothetical protein
MDTLVGDYLYHRREQVVAANRSRSIAFHWWMLSTKLWRQSVEKGDAAMSLCAVEPCIV